MKIGFLVICIGIIHIVFGFIFFSEVWIEIFRLGFFNSIGEDPLRGAVAWFFLFGVPVISYGYLIEWIQKKIGFYPKHLIWNLFILFIFGVLLMPASGFWLLLIPIFILWKKGKTSEEN